MQTPLRITFRHTAHSQALEVRIRELTEKLERFHDRIIGCHVVIDGPAVHPENGGVFSAHVEVTVPGGTVNAVSAPQTHRDAYAAVTDVFARAKRQLNEFVETH